MTDGLTGSELAIVEAIADRLIPSDESGPGASEAKVGRYIERALATEYREHLPAYAEGLAAVERHAVSEHGASFVSLTPERQDAVLADVERGRGSGLSETSSAFFELVRRHALEGMFGDPALGGNAGLVGWRLLGYEGPRLVWSEEEQRLGEA